MSTTVSSSQHNSGFIPGSTGNPVSSAHSDIIVQLAQSAIHKTQHEYNGEFLEIPAREPLYLAIDGTGALRQVWEFFVNSIAIAKKLGGPIAAAITAAVGFCIVSVVAILALGVTGVCNTYIALRWWLQDAKQTLKANKEKLALLEQVERSLNNLPLHFQLTDFVSSQNQPEVQLILNCLMKMGGGKIDKDNLEKLKEEVAEAVKIAKLSVTSHKLYALMGVGQTTLAAVGMLTDAGSKVFHYASVLVGAGATVASSVSSMVLGAIYIVRGKCMLKRAKKSYTLVQDFREGFNKSQNIDAAMSFMAQAEQRDAVDGNLARRVNATCLKAINGTYTASGFKQDNGVLVPYDANGKLEYLKRVDKGIHTEELKQTVAQKIANAMIWGGYFALIAGALGLLALVLSNPASLTALFITMSIIGIISAAYFLSVEKTFLMYDSTTLFAKKRDATYKTAQWIQDIEKAMLKKEAEESQVQPKPGVEQSKETPKENPIKILDKEMRGALAALDKEARERLAALDKEARERLAALESEVISA